MYEKAKAKRIVSWRAVKIFDDCDGFIRQTPELPLSVLPRSRQKVFFRRLLGVLVTHTARLLTEQEGIIRTGLCLGCHQEMNDEALWSGFSKAGRLTKDQHTELMNRLFRGQATGSR